MSTQYVMRALNTNLGEHVYWYSLNTPDSTGSLSGYPVDQLTSIVVDYSTTVPDNIGVGNLNLLVGPAGPAGDGYFTAEVTSGNITSGKAVLLINGKIQPFSTSTLSSAGYVAGIALSSTTVGSIGSVKTQGSSSSFGTLGSGYRCAVGVDSSGNPCRITDSGCVSGFSILGYCDESGTITVSPRKDSVFNVQDFGAKGDGITDDTIPISLAITRSFSNGRVVLFPYGDYRITSTITIPEACSLIGPTCGPPGGTNATGNGFATIVHDFDGNLFVFNGANGGGVSSGGGIEGLRITQKYGSSGGSTHRGSAIVLTSIDVAHRPSWIKLRKLLIEESGNDPWTDAIHIDGYNARSDAGILDLFCGEISTHLSSTSSNSFYINGVGTIQIYNCQLYLYGSNITVAGGSDNYNYDVQLNNVNANNISFDYASDCSIYGGIFNTITTTSHTTGTNTFMPGRLTTGFADSSGNNNTGAVWYDANINTYSSNGATRFSKSVVLENGFYYLVRNAAGNGVIPALSVDANDAILIGGRSSGHPIVFGRVVNYNSVGTDDLVVASGVSLRSQNAASNDTFSLVKSTTIDGYNSLVIGDSKSRTVSLVGGVINTVQEVVSDYVIDGYGNGDYIIGVEIGSAPISITLPANPNKGRMLLIKDINGLSGTYNITINGNGKNIDGNSSFIISQNYASLTIMYNGASWSILW